MVVGTLLGPRNLGSDLAMSMIRCESCSHLIDSDDDPDCFVYVGNYKRLHAEMVLCERCRDEREAEQESEDSAAAFAEGMHP